MDPVKGSKKRAKEPNVIRKEYYWQISQPESIDAEAAFFNVRRIFSKSMKIFLHRYPHFYAISRPIKLLETLKILGKQII